MHTAEILQRDWTMRLDKFSRAHEGWPVSLDILAESMGAQSAFHQLSLAGITAEPVEGWTISITVAVPRGFLTHTIHAPVRLLIVESAGSDGALEVESAYGTKAILRFNVAPPVVGLVRGRCGPQ